jgi:alpha-1,3-rhamnosyl/mannosyltransferase
MEKVMCHAIERGSHIITPTRVVKNEVQEFYGVDSQNVTAIHEGVSDVFRARGAAQCLSLFDYGLQYRKFFLFVGSLEPRKNIVRIVEAYLSARQKHGFSWPLILVGGPGWQNSRELETIENLTQRGWGRYLGPVTQQVLAELYASTRALLFPSVYEGFGLPALEAQRSGTPTITSAGSAMAEFSCAADTLVNPLDVQDISAAISYAALEAPVTISLSATPAAKLTWDLTAQKTQVVYQQLQQK